MLKQWNIRVFVIPTFGHLTNQIKHRQVIFFCNSGFFLKNFLWFGIWVQKGFNFLPFLDFLKRILVVWDFHFFKVFRFQNLNFQNVKRTCQFGIFKFSWISLKENKWFGHDFQFSIFIFYLFKISKMIGRFSNWNFEILKYILKILLIHSNF